MPLFSSVRPFKNRVGFVRGATLEKLRRNQQSLIALSVNNRELATDLAAFIDTLEVSGGSVRMIEAPLGSTPEAANYVNVSADLGGGIETVQAAKPFELRGHVATRDVNGESQAITPPFAAGDFVLCIGGDWSVAPGGVAAASDGLYYSVISSARVWAEV